MYTLKKAEELESPLKQWDYANIAEIHRKCNSIAHQSALILHLNPQLKISSKWHEFQRVSLSYQKKLEPWLKTLVLTEDVGIFIRAIPRGMGSLEWQPVQQAVQQRQRMAIQLQQNHHEYQPSKEQQSVGRLFLHHAC